VTPLLSACDAGHVEMVTVLLDGGADVNQANVGVQCVRTYCACVCTVGGLALGSCLGACLLVLVTGVLGDCCVSGRQRAGRPCASRARVGSWMWHGRCWMVARISAWPMCVCRVCARAHGGKVGSGVVPGRLFAGPGDGCVCVRPLLYVAGGWLDALVHRQ
jgi:hypothetical protein